MAIGKTVQDVSSHESVKAYSAHLKRSGKVAGFVRDFRALPLRWKFTTFLIGAHISCTWYRIYKKRDVYPKMAKQLFKEG